MALRRRKLDFDPLVDETPGTNPRHIAIFALTIISIIGVATYLKSLSINLDSFFLAIFIVGGAAILFFSFVNIEAASIGLLFFIPFANVSLPGLSYFFTISDAYLCILSMAWLLKLVIKREHLVPPSPLSRPIYLFVFLTIFSLLVSPNIDQGIADVIQTIEYFIMAYLVFQTTLNRKDAIDAFILQLAASSILISGYGIFEYFQAGGGDTRVSSSFGHFNAFGAYLALVIPIFFCMLLSEKILWRKYIFIAALSINGLAVLFTYSRGAWMGLLAAFILIGQLKGMQQFIRIVLLITLGIISISLFLPRNQRFTARAASITDFNDDSTQSRFMQYQMAENIMLESPLFGTGTGGMLSYAAQRGMGGNAEIHNIFLSIGAERGVPTALVLFWIFFVFYKMMVARINNSRYVYFQSVYIGFLASIFAFVVVNLTAFQLVRGLGILLGIFLAMGVAAGNVEDEMIAEGQVMDEDDDQNYIMRTPSLSERFSRIS